MAFPPKKRPAPTKSEASESSEEEAGESSKEMTSEMREGSEEPMAKGRRRKNKPMKDGDCSCGAKSKKDFAMGPGMKMDALTPQEYLDACDMGIQSANRAYIRARIDAEQRLDLKCGKGSISQGEKCTKGGTQTAMNVAKIVGGVALAGGAIYAASKGSRAIHARQLKTKNNIANAKDLRNKGNDVMYATREANNYATENLSPNATQQERTAVEFQNRFRTINSTASRGMARNKARTELANAKSTAIPSKARMRRALRETFNRKNTKPSDPWKSDSIYAAGFSVDHSRLAI